MKSIIKSIIILTGLAATAIGLIGLAQATPPTGFEIVDLGGVDQKDRAYSINVWPSGDLTGQTDVQNVQ